MAILLVVDDEPDVRFLVQIIASQQGHEVIEAADGVEALEILESRPVDAVVTDFNMPRMNGVVLRDRIRARWPELQIVGEEEAEQVGLYLVGEEEAEQVGL